jgi:hypothetical protein
MEESAYEEPVALRGRIDAINAGEESVYGEAAQDIWLQTELSKIDTEVLLHYEKLMEGTFLVRNSQSRAGQMTLRYFFLFCAM